MKNNNNDSFVVFPFLKTSSPVHIGKYTFRSTDDTDTLTDTQATQINEISRMLFLQNDLRIKSASYAIIPYVDFNYSDPRLEDLECIQNVIAYFYASPRHEFGDLFLTSEHASMVIFSPGRVMASLVYPDFNTDQGQPKPEYETTKYREIEGYAGLYNFKHHFWVSENSRVYGPVHHLTLNHSQDLKNEFNRNRLTRADYRLLYNLLQSPKNSMSSRVFTSLKWFNAANNSMTENSTAIVNLAIAFEALLKLPSDEKSNRLIDSISLLLGRIPRLDVWAQQFYKIRSQIVHEGFANETRFIASDKKNNGIGQTYQSIVSYGRQIFQLCLGTLLCGEELSRNAGLEETFITNQERYTKICEILKDTNIDIVDRINQTDKLICTIKQYQYVTESDPDLQLKTMLSAIQLAITAFLENTFNIPEKLKSQIEDYATSDKKRNKLQKLDKLKCLSEIFNNNSFITETELGLTVKTLIDDVWGKVFQHYYWIKQGSIDDQK